MATVFILVTPAVEAAGVVNIVFGRSWPLSLAIDPVKGAVYVDAESGDYPPTGFTFGLINATSGTVDRTLGLPGEPGQIAVDETTGMVYVASNDSINVFDPKTNSFGAPLRVGLPIFSLVYDNLSRDLILTSGNSVYQVDPSNGAVLRSAVAGESAQGIAVDWVKGEVYVACYLSDSVSVFADPDLSMVKRISLPASTYPSELAFDKARGEVYVTTDQSSIVVLSTSTYGVSESISLAAAGQGSTSTLAVDERDSLVFVSSNPGKAVAELNPADGQVIASFPVNSTVYAMAFDRGTDRLFATNYHLVTVITPVPPGTSPIFFIVTVVVALAVVTAVVVAVYSRVVTASGGRRDDRPLPPQKPLSS